MALIVAIPKETASHETRVAASPETVKKMVAMGCQVVIESRAGEASSFTDSSYQDAGAQVVHDSQSVLKNANIVLCVQKPDLKQFSKGALLIGMLAPYMDKDLPVQLASAGIDAFAMELLPRISRAQSMDVLSSQSNLAGYRAVLEACARFGRAMPMMMTAAGTVPPARVMIMGAGVAGLQAIATAKRLGAIVCATDVRAAAKEQVQSLGASFVAIEDEEFKAAETAGGYAKEMSDEYKKKQQTLIEETIKKQDIVITTALIPGRPAPRLIGEAMVKSMKPGSVIVDMAVEMGGNCEISKAGDALEVHGVHVLGYKNLPSRLADSASALYAKNLLNLLGLIIKDETLTIDYEDEIIKGICLTRSGEIIHPNFKAAEKADAAKKSSKKN